MVTLDVVDAFTHTRLDDVGVNGSLSEVLDLLPLRGGVCSQVPLSVLEHPDELFANDLAFRLRVLNTFQTLQETVFGVDRHEVDSTRRGKIFFNLFALTFTEQTMINKNAG